MKMIFIIKADVIQNDKNDLCFFHRYIMHFSKETNRSRMDSLQIYFEIIRYMIICDIDKIKKI